MVPVVHSGKSGAGEDNIFCANRGAFPAYSVQATGAVERRRFRRVSAMVAPEQLLDWAWQITREFFLTQGCIGRRLARAVRCLPSRDLLVRAPVFGVARESLAAVVLAAETSPSVTVVGRQNA